MYETINPFPEERIQSFEEHKNAELESVIAKAQETYENDWKRRSPAKRKPIVKKAAKVIRHKRDEFANINTIGPNTFLLSKNSELSAISEKSAGFQPLISIFPITYEWCSSCTVRCKK
jgi:succinate-semialdehyde dehydrogenase/glutarate-semialdehyde dehydrogenase